MVKFVIRIKHFDVSIINRTENMTLVGGITQLDNESEVYRKKGDPQEKRQSSEGKIVIPENGSPKTTLKLGLFFCDY